MKKVDSELIGMDFSFWVLENILKDHGFARGAMWDWDYAVYDHPLVKSKIGYYTYLRICTEALSGRIEESDCHIKVTDVFITEAKYHSGLDLDKEVAGSQVKEAMNILKQVGSALKVNGEFQVRDANDDEKSRHRGVRKKH